MQRYILSGAFVALVSQALAGVVPTDEYELDFVNQKWESVTVGQKWPIEWSKGNGNSIALAIKGEHWEHVIGGKEPAPGKRDWTVEVPHCDKEYHLELNQDDCGVVESPKFYVKCANDAPHGKKVVIVYFDKDCSCEKRKETDKPWPKDKPTNEKYVYYDEELKCSVTAQPPAPTGAWADVKDPSDSWKDASDPTGKWKDAKDPSGEWKDSDPAKPSGQWSDADPAKPTGQWADADPAKPSGQLADADPAKPSGQWADADPAKPAGSSSPVSPLDGKKDPKIDAYTGTAAKIGGSISALVVVLAAVMVL